MHVFFGEKTRTHFSFHLSRCSIRPRTEDTYLPKHRRDLQSYCTIQSSLLPALPPAGTGFLPSYSYLILMIIKILGSWFVALEFCKYDTESNMFSTWSCGHLFAAVVRYIVSDGAFPCATGTTPYLCRGMQIDFFCPARVDGHIELFTDGVRPLGLSFHNIPGLKNVMSGSSCPNEDLGLKIDDMDIVAAYSTCKLSRTRTPLSRTASRW